MKRMVLFIVTIAVAIASGPGLDSAIAMNSSTAAGQTRTLSVLVLLGEWFGDAYFPLEKEIEARGWTMKRVGLDGEYRGCYNKKRDVALRSDIVIQDKVDLSGFDALIIPSGPQWRKFNENPTVLAFVRSAHAAGLIVASFCAGNTTVKAAGLVDLPAGPALYPDKVTLVKERVLIGPRGGGPPPGDGFESAPIKEICDAVAREVASSQRPATPRSGEIHAAVRSGDLAKVQALVARDPKVVNEKDAQGRTPLHFASAIGNMEIVRYLIAGGADVRATDPDGFTPLHWAAYEGKADAAKALIAAGADPNARGGPGVDTLESALYGRHSEAVEALLQGGLRVETQGEAGRALLHRAASAGFLSLVEHLLKNGADASGLSETGATLLHSAAAGGLKALVDKLVSGGANVNSRDDLGQTPLHLAAAAGRQDMVEALIAKGADKKVVCLNGRTLLHCAAAGGIVDLMGRLLKEGYPLDGPDRYGRTPLFLAAQAGSDAGAEFLLSKGANVMAREFWGSSTPLHVATFSGNLRLLEVLVKHGADVNALNDEGSTPLLYISQAGRAEVMDWLIEHGAKLDARNDLNETALSYPLVNGFQGLVEKLWPRAEALKTRDLLEKYPLHRAAYLGYEQPAAFLLEKGLPVDSRDESGRTPFQRAAQGGNVKLARMLLAKGAEVDAKDPDGSTPLHLAVKKGREEMVRFLLQNKADPKAEDGRGRNAPDLAAEYAYPGIAEVLKAAGAGPAPGAGTRDVASLLATPLKSGEAIVWHLGHCGFAVKTRSRLLIFDYWPRERAPEKPSLANGFVDPEEIKGQDVTVFVSHSHSDHFDPVILTWRQAVENITYVFGWKARKGERMVDLPAPRAAKTLKGMEIYTVNCEQDDVPESAFLVKVDGLSIYHSGDYLGPADGFKADMDYLLDKAGVVDLAFVGRIRQAELLKPKVVFPIHAGGREYMYGAFARKAADKKLPSRVVCAENKGDRFELFDDPVSRPERLAIQPHFENQTHAYISPDGKYLFFSVDGDIWWVSSKVIEALRPK